MLPETAAGCRARFGPWLAVVLLLGVSPSAAGQSADAGAELPHDGLGFRAAFGWTNVSGDYGDLITQGAPAEGGVWYQAGPVRSGVNIHVASYDVVEPFDSQSISQVEINLSAIWRFRTDAPLQPFAGLRGGVIRFQPEGALFDPTPPGPDVLPGGNEAPNGTGFVGGLVAGLEYWLNRHLALQLSGSFRAFSTEELELLLLDTTGVEKGTAADLRFGVEWKP